MIAVDDAQDATGSTIALLRAFAGRGVAVLAFGDPDVASTAFRGARSEILGRLGAALGVPAARRLLLSTVYRGRPELRALIGSVVGHIGTALAGVQRRAELAPALADAAPHDFPATVRIEAPSHAGQKSGELARLLRKHPLLRGMPWSRMAVIVRSGGDIAGLERGLALSDVPTRNATARRALRDDQAAAQLLAAAC